jgi:hypothetical protein
MDVNGIIIPDSYPLEIQALVKERLESDPYFHTHRVKIYQQDSAEVLQMINESLSVLDGPVIVIALTQIEGNAPGVILHIDLIVTEDVLVNRSRASFDTALNVAYYAAMHLTETDDFIFDNLRHEVTEEGLFQAVVSLRY